MNKGHPRGRRRSHLLGYRRRSYSCEDPANSSFTDRALVSHETACVLNAGGSDAHVALTILPIASRPGPTALLCQHGARCICGLTILKNPRRFRVTDFSSLFVSDVPIVVQHARLDSRHAKVSLLSTTAMVNHKPTNQHKGYKSFLFLQHERNFPLRARGSKLPTVISNIVSMPG